MTKSKKKIENKKKLNKKKVLIFLVVLTALILILYKVINSHITNIYISGNNLLSDQEIIDLAGLKNYPNSLNNSSFKIKKKLKKSIYIKSATVRKKGILNRLYIDVKENYPLFFYKTDNKTILFDGSKVDSNYISPTVINTIPNTIYEKFVSNMDKVNLEILNRISEIEYKPNEVDDERFLLLMNDGNYVYLTLSKFLNINKYIDIIEKLSSKKGVLYLDSGEYIDVFDE